ncbi:hypothetical protein Taro_008486 [Colocasia esculenta]|uniref:uridine nucleosidase n=1 Tax=Colocasia esculenta TaxID=4460 RepID=A0A843U3I4_COLES|nr:hypothetical protein [Colocasia esculenta]
MKRGNKEASGLRLVRADAASSQHVPRGLRVVSGVNNSNNVFFKTTNTNAGSHQLWESKTKSAHPPSSDVEGWRAGRRRQKADCGGRAGGRRMAETDSHTGVANGCHVDGAEMNGGIPPLQKLIIDTDPGIDDSMTILMAFQMRELEIVGLTTVFGNVHTEDATRNALLLCEVAGHPDVPVAEGSQEPLKGGKPRVADFVHGSDGLGNIHLPPPKGQKIEKTASEFLVEKVSEYPGSVSILALGPLTNLALAIKRDSSFASKVKRIVILGGAFFAAGNVNPAAEANIYGDPEAADVVFTSGADIVVVGINITTQVKFTDDDLAELRSSKGRHAQFICDMCKFYRDWHVKSDGVHGIFLHDPVSFLALVRPDLFTFKKGVVRVETQGICVGHTLLDQGLKKWNTSNPWTGFSPISVAWTVDVPGVLSFIRNLLMKP